MGKFAVLEDDIHIGAIGSSANKAGFMAMRLAVFSPQALELSLPEFEDYLKGGQANQRFAEVTRAQMQDRRLFFLYKGGDAQGLDSRSRAGLADKLSVNLPSSKVRAGVPLVAHAVVTNTGSATWLPASVKVGAVLLGCRLLDSSGKMLNEDFFRQPLTPGKGRAIAPGETLKLDVRLPPLSKGAFVLRVRPGQRIGRLVQHEWFRDSSAGN